MKKRIEREWYTVYDYKIMEALVRDNKWKEYHINITKYLEKILQTDFRTRYAYMEAVVNSLPKELPYSIRKFLVFFY